MILLLILITSCGIILPTLLVTLPNLLLVLALVLFLLVLLLAAKLLHYELITRIFLVLLCFFLGVSWCLIAIRQTNSWSLTKQLENKKVVVVGYVDSLPRTQNHFVSFVFNARVLNGEKVNIKIQLNWYQGHPKLTVGDKWQLTVKLKRPHGYMNPGGFDYEKYLFLHHIRALGYVVASEKNEKLATNLTSYSIQRVRQYLAAEIMDLTYNDHLAGIIVGLLLGSRNYITQDEWQIFRNSGTSHLIAIAGLHVGMIFGFFYLLIKFIWRRSRKLCQLLPATSSAILFAFIFSFVYALLSGFSLPTRRAIIMLTTFVLVSLLRRNVSVWSGIALALLLVLIIEPLAPLDTGFWLSFNAVSILLFSLHGRLNIKNLWWKYGRAQYVILIGLAPITLLAFGQLSLIAFFANMLAIPVVGLLIMPLSLCAMFCLFINRFFAGYLLYLALQILHLLWKVLSWMVHFHIVVCYHSIFNFWILITATLGAILILAPKGLPGRYLGIFILFPLFFYRPPQPKKGEVWFTLLDVGQGLASVIRTQNHTLIFDTGPKYSADYDAGEAIVVPFLHYQGINKIDKLIISHGDNDHIGGAQSIISLLKVNEIRTSVPDRFSKNNAYFCRAGEKWSYDGVDFEFVSPKQVTPYQGNNSSCVLHVSTGNNSLLLTGDIEKPAEEEILHNYKNQIAATIIVAPHHGSATSSSWSFIRAVNPQFVLFPVGYLNRFKFPSKAVVLRYQQLKAHEFDTANDGAIFFVLPANLSTPSPILYRQIARRFWNY